MSRSVLVGTVAALVLSSSAQAADPAAGKARFAAECSLCHSAEPGDGAGGMGPALYSLLGKPAATADEAFPYSPALRGAKLTWDPANLDRFLSGPGILVPGTAMPILVTDKAARDDLIAYFQSLRAAAPASSSATGDRR